MPSFKELFAPTPETFEEVHRAGLGAADEQGATNERNLEVTSTVLMKGSNSTDLGDQQSPWEQWLAGQDHHHTVGTIFFAGTFAMFAAGIGAYFYRKYRTLAYDSYDFYLRHIDNEKFKLADLPEATSTEAEQAKYTEAFLARKISTFIRTALTTEEKEEFLKNSLLAAPNNPRVQELDKALKKLKSFLEVKTEYLKKFNQTDESLRKELTQKANIKFRQQQINKFITNILETNETVKAKLQEKTSNFFQANNAHYQEEFKTFTKLYLSKERTKQTLEEAFQTKKINDFIQEIFAEEQSIRKELFKKIQEHDYLEKLAVEQESFIAEFEQKEEQLRQQKISRNEEPEPKTSLEEKLVAFRSKKIDQIIKELSEAEKENLLSNIDFSDIETKQIKEKYLELVISIGKTKLEKEEKIFQKACLLKKQADLVNTKLTPTEEEQILAYAALLVEIDELSQQEADSGITEENSKLKKLKAQREKREKIFALQVTFNKRLLDKTKPLKGKYNGEYRIDFSSIDAIRLMQTKAPDITPPVDLKHLDSNSIEPNSLGVNIPTVTDKTDALADDIDATIDAINVPTNGIKATSAPSKSTNPIVHALNWVSEKVIRTLDWASEKYVAFSKTSKVAGFFRRTWDLINWQTMGFWIAWIAANFFVGLSVLNASIMLSWIVLGIATLPLLIYGGWKLINYIRHRNEPTLTAEQQYEKEKTEEEQTELLQTLEQDVFIKLDQQHKKEILQKLGVNTKQPTDQEIYSAKLAEAEEKDIKDSESYKALMGRKAGRVTKLVATTWLGAVGGFVGPQFVTWVLSTFCTALAGSIAHAGTAAAITWIGGTLIGGPITMFALGIPFALFFAFKAFAKANAAQNAYKEKVEATLNQEIQITVNNQTKTVKKWQHFDALLAEINDLKKDIETARESIKTSLGDKTEHEGRTSTEWLGADYDLNNSDPLKHDFFEKKRHKVPAWTRFKQVLNRTFTVQGGLQTGFLVGRFVFLGTFGFAGLLALSINPVLGFFIIGATLAAFVAAPRIFNYHTDSKQKQREKAVEHIDQRIEFAQEEVENLRGLKQQLQGNKDFLEKSVQDDPSSDTLLTSNNEESFSLSPSSDDISQKPEPKSEDEDNDATVLKAPDAGRNSDVSKNTKHVATPETSTPPIELPTATVQERQSAGAGNTPAKQSIRPTFNLRAHLENKTEERTQPQNKALPPAVQNAIYDAQRFFRKNPIGDKSAGTTCAIEVKNKVAQSPVPPPTLGSAA